MDITLLEELQYNAFPPLQTLLYDGWTIRFGGNFTYRVNCCSPLYVTQTPTRQQLDRIESLYRGAGLKGCIFKLHQGMGGLADACDALLDARGYNEDRRGNIFLCGLETFCRDTRSPVTVETEIRDEWLEDFLTMNGTADPRQRAAAMSMLKSIRLPVLAASIRKEGQMLACGLGVCERGFVGLYDIYVRDDCRRLGLGADLCTGIMNRAKAMGCGTAYLQVLADNAGARALYRMLGYVQDYTYWFRVNWFA